VAFGGEDVVERVMTLAHCAPKFTPVALAKAALATKKPKTAMRVIVVIGVR